MLPSRIFLDDFLDDLTPSKENNKMICDIYEEDGKYFIEVDVPGFKKEDIKIECDKGNLKIVAEKHSNKEEHNKKKYIHRERKFYEKCERSFYLGDVDESKISAEFKDGTLKIVVPKAYEKSKKSDKLNFTDNEVFLSKYMTYMIRMKNRRKW